MPARWTRKTRTWSNYRRILLDLLTHADARLLAEYQPAIHALDGIGDSDRKQIDERIKLLSTDAEACWTELNAFCEREKSSQYKDIDFAHACRLVEAIARHGDSQTQRVLEILREEVAADLIDHPMVWLEPLAVRLAGEMRLEAAIPLIIAKMHKGKDDDLLLEESEEALRKIGADAVVDALSADYARAEFGFRVSVAAVLECIHSDLTVAKCLELLPIEDDSELIAWLGQALVRQFSFEAVEPLRQLILRMPSDPEMSDVRNDFVAACTLMETTVPEFEQWKEDAKHDAEQDSEYRAKALAEFARDQFEEDETDYEYDEADILGPPQSFRHEQPPVGRNDPCPCGSGKKYKKCCLAKQRQQPAQAVRRFPIGTIALYGPDDKRTTKIAASVIAREGAEPILERWVGNNLKDNPKVRREIQAFFKRHGVRSIVASDRNMGCPHEEGADFPQGGDCPFCPFWKGKQGSGATSSHSFGTWEATL